ncbi:hypothetical protein [[Mycobacterium] wendilense]|uniref:PE-PGRS family protein n=1 Tax=[Mycobacterium] wendilense TaxID=3064284 RepID=A0ABM9M988_9MYCO|nr:hypothetical protein [Mycolicibacterium sp. MU0050]CAJ1579558.1 hypothetical protein MU0050_000569 [Mycolicibacterium sp. MU0050]
MAGVAVASAGALALTPVAVTPDLPEVQVNRADAYGLSAFQNPFEVWGDTAENTFGTLFTTIPGRVSLLEAVSVANTKLATALSRPDVQAQFAAVLGNVTDPDRITTTLAALPGYAQRFSAAGAGALETFQVALAGLPGVLEQAAAALADGDIVEAFGEINEWFLADILSGGRAEYLDALRVPGDFFDSLGIEPLARILGTSWMATPLPNGQLDGPGLLSRGVIGNFGRALLAPQVTAIFQTLEIVDDAMTALNEGDFETAASSLINAPAKITNAFLNGFKPKFVEDGSIPSGPGQNFPGLFSKDSTFDFFLRQVPEKVAEALTVGRPLTETDAEVTSESFTRLASDAPNVSPSNRKLVAVATDTEAPAKDPSLPPADPGVEAPDTDDLVVDEGDATDPKPVSTKDRLKQIREQSAEQRAERAEKARAAVDRVRSNIRKGLGISEKSKDSDSDGDGAGQASGGSDNSDKSTDTGGSEE